MAAATNGRVWADGVDPDEHLNAMRRAAIAMLLVGALSCAIGVQITQRTELGKAAQGGFAVGFALCGLLLLLTRPRVRVMQGCVLLSIVFISGLMATSTPIGMAPFFYLWPIAYAAYFCSRRMLVTSFILMVTTLSIGLALNPTSVLKLDTFIGTVSSVGLIAALIAAMTRREARLRKDLARVAQTDPLTDLLNRRAFNPALEALIAEAVGGGPPVSVAMFDIDHFKRFNDEHGHIAGDNALCRVADLLREHSKQHDLVARFGGEEFAVALPAADAHGARSYAERVGQVLRDEGIDSVLALSVSAGIATFGDTCATLDALLARADAALYAAKNAGRARAAWWDGTIQIGAEVGSGGSPTPLSPVTLAHAV
jgi:diguanylate cyclase (GGDEF)-like protein